MTTLVNTTVGSQTINSTTPLFVTINGLVSTVSQGITFALGSDPGSVIVAGNVVARNGIVADGNDHIDIAQTGTVLGTDGSDPIGMRLNGDGNSARIAGTVTSDGIGMYLSPSASNNEIVITESGVLRGGASNHDGGGGNTYSGAFMAHPSSGTTLLVNNGDIIAEVNPDTGFRIAIGNASSGGAPNFLSPETESVLHFFNTGFVFGDVYFAAGNDLYDARGGGIVNGEIDMGIGEDIFRGGNHDEEAYGGLNDDMMRGGGGDDTLNGQLGADSLVGNQGDDELFGSFGLDTLDGGFGNDVLNGGANADEIRGGAHSDELNGGDGGDFMVGGDGQDDMVGGRGRDEMRGASGDDQLAGGQGNDTLTGGTGDDTLRGNDNYDTYVFTRGFDRDVVIGFSDNNNEKLDLSRVGSIVNFNDLSNNHLSQSGDDAIIDAGNGNVITLEDFAANALDAGDFIF